VAAFAAFYDGNVLYPAGALSGIAMEDTKHCVFFGIGAGDGTRTRDVQLGKTDFD